MIPESKNTSAAPTAPRGEYMFGDGVILAAPNSPRAEAVRTLRTHVMAQHIDGGRRGLVVCGPSAGVGASFTAVNLAVSLAQVGVKTLLMDGDLRTPSLEKFIAPPATALGLRQCLENPTLSVSDCVHSDVLDNMSVMYSGGATASAQELLASDRFGVVMSNCLRDYDLTIVDAPPANTCADARRISTVAGYSLIVAKRHETFVADLKILAAQLREDRAQIVGTVMSEV